jgi:hypothetical protein
VFEDLNVDIITSDRTPAQRERTVRQFRLGKIWFLIATDLMARGIDFKGTGWRGGSEDRRTGGPGGGCGGGVGAEERRGSHYFRSFVGNKLRHAI